MFDFGGGRFGGGQRKPTTAENEHARSISGVMGVHSGGGNQRKPTTTKNERERSFSGVVG